MVIGHGRVFLHEYLVYHVFARMKGFEWFSQPAYFYFWVYWRAFTPFAFVALLGLLLHLKGQRKSSIVISIVFVTTISYSLIGSKLMAYVLPAFLFLSVLAALALQRLKTAKYAVVCAVIILFLYWFCRATPSGLRTATSLVMWDQSIRGMSLLRLLVQARPSDHDLSPTPLIICMDGFRFQKQQAVFYGDRPVIEAFLNVPTASLEEDRYEHPVPIDQVVTSRPMPIIIRKDLYPQLAYSEKYSFRVIAQGGPLILGQTSRL